MLFHQRFIPGLAVSSYFIGDESSGEAVVIDPTRDVAPFLDLARQNGLTIRHIIETHVHADFVSGAAELISHLRSGVDVHCSGEGGAEWVPPYADPVVHHGHEFQLGSLRFCASHTPGHTSEHCSWGLFDDSRSREVPFAIFTGDFLFVGDVGRPDLLGEEELDELAGELYQSVFERTEHWPDFAEIYPGHGAGSLCGKAMSSRRSSTMGYERRFNRALQRKPKQLWIDELLTNMPEAPPYFQRMKRVNRQGPALMSSILKTMRRLTIKQLNELVDEPCVLLDVRTKEAFSASHIPGSINIPLADSLPTWAGWAIPHDQDVVLIADSENATENALLHLSRIGMDQVVGIYHAGLDNWQLEAGPVANLNLVTPERLFMDFGQSGNSSIVVDVRSKQEWDTGHVEGARHIPLSTLSSMSRSANTNESDRGSTELATLPKDANIKVICGAGYRGAIAASILQSAGFSSVSNVVGGMTRWHAAELPVCVEGETRAQASA